MDDVVVARVNDTLDGIRRQVAALEHRSQAMQEGCAEKRLAVENWSNTQVALDDEHNTQYIRKAAAREEELARLQLNVQQLQSESASVSQREESDRQEAAELEAQIKELRKTQESIPEEQRQLRSGNEADNAKVETRRARLMQMSRRAAAEESKVRSELEMSQKAIGMVAEQLEQRAIRFTFTQIDAAQPSAGYHVTVALSADRKTLTALSCVPMIATFDALRAELHASAKLEVFLRRARRAFKLLADM